MEAICIKIEENLLKKMNQIMNKNGYATKTEFIREAIRDKIKSDEKEELIKELLTLKGKAPKSKLSDREIREKALLELAKDKGWN
jgi:metal-responsive CopG/Arc/MetJ family transcriptional regulator